jgi:hypothetical protein
MKSAYTVVPTCMHYPLGTDMSAGRIRGSRASRAANALAPRATMVAVEVLSSGAASVRAHSKARQEVADIMIGSVLDHFPCMGEAQVLKCGNRVLQSRTMLTKHVCIDTPRAQAHGNR